MKKLLSSFLMIIICNSMIGQNEKIFQNIKTGVYTEFFSGPLAKSNTTYFDETKAVISFEEYRRVTGVSIFSIGYNIRYNLFEPSDNFGVGISASPTLGLTVTDDGFGSFNIPVFATINLGAGSTYSSTTNMGFFIGAGYEFTKLGLVGGADKYESPNVTNYDLISSWGSLIAVTGVRWWTKSNRLSELTLKYGFGAADETPSKVVGQSAFTSTGSSYTISITWGRYINY